MQHDDVTTSKKNTRNDRTNVGASNPEETRKQRYTDTEEGFHSCGQCNTQNKNYLVGPSDCLMIIFTWLVLLALAAPHGVVCYSSFLGKSVPKSRSVGVSVSNGATLTMRKQKASDRRTRRLQRGLLETDEDLDMETVTTSPMQTAQWSLKKPSSMTPIDMQLKTGGRNRSRKRSTLYNSLSSYHSHFLQLLTAEYKAEEEEVLGRLKASLDDPLALEAAGYALFDMYAERRGNLFSDEVYRLSKAHDACTNFLSDTSDSTLPPNHKFSTNDVIMLTYQPNGSGDIFGADRLPTSTNAIAAEARILNTGPTYVDIAMSGGAFEAAFGPAPNDGSGNGNRRLRLRVDRFLSNVPYQRMVSALSQMTTIPEIRKRPEAEGIQQGQQGAENAPTTKQYGNICMDEIFRETIISTFMLHEPSSIFFRDTEACDLREVAKSLARPPLPNSATLANQVLSYMQTNPHGIFSAFNGPQLTAIGAALTRRLTMVQGPPGTGKTTVAAAIAFGFVHQCRTIAPRNTKVLACAFSNVGADNLAESALKLGLKVVRIGKASGVSKQLWNHTLDAAIDADPKAQRALQQAAAATSQLNRVKQKSNRNQDSILSDQSKRALATAAVKASIKACNIAATKALRDADVIVTTSTGAADPRLLAACGILSEDDVADEGDYWKESTKKTKMNGKVGDASFSDGRALAPDGLAPLSLPFVLVDEACQSVEPATLIPLISSNSCRALVLLGDPCQLPPTVKSSPESPLGLSLMERLAATMPAPVIVTAQNDQSEKDTSFLESKSTKQAMSLLRVLDASQPKVAYRKQFAGSLLLSVQYRMHPSIAAFSSAVFYNSQLSTPSYMRHFRKFPSLTSSIGSLSESSVGRSDDIPNVRFVHVGGRCNERLGSPSSKLSKRGGGPMALYLSDATTSYSNEAEAERIVEVLKDVLKNNKGASIGVVSPYTGQVELIKELMSKDKEYEKLAVNLEDPVEVKSVDGYQGRERDIILFSTVRSNRSGSIGFLRDWRRMNVALTRAKNGLIVVGDLDCLEEGDKHWAAFGKWCRGVQCVVE